jgi:glycosyltransferase involved in cell wall biosynthesis
MLVSVIVPTRNRPDQLAAALQSITSQAHRNTEIIVVDDGSSPDNAASNESCVDAAAGPHSKHYLYLSGHNQAGNGPSYARNAGVQLARGELLAFCDDDDYWCDAQSLASAVECFRSVPDLDLFFANQEKHARGRKISATWLEGLVEKMAPLQPGARTLVSKHDCLFASDNLPHMNTCVIRRPLWEKLGGFWDELRYCEDVDLFVRAVDAARGVMYWHQTVAVHNVPDRTLKMSASSLVEKDRCIARVHVSSHLIQCCTDPASIRYACGLAGEACRRLTHESVANGTLEGALTWAKLASAWKATFKWTIYTGYLGARSLLSRTKGAISG